MARPEAGNPDLAPDLAVGMIQACLELIERHLNGQSHAGRAQFLNVGLHDVVTPRLSGCRYPHWVPRPEWGQCSGLAMPPMFAAPLFAKATRCWRLRPPSL